jgi:predicted dehydrogenase
MRQHFSATGNANPMTGPRYRLAIIGCGRMGRLHTARLHEETRAIVVALYDVDAGAACSLQQDLAPDAAVYDDVDALLQAGDLDAAVICTPTTAHFEQVRACRERGLAVLCEKPLADTAERTLQLIDQSQSGPPLVVAYQRRSWATYRTLHREVASGRWGPIRAVTSHNTEFWQQTIAGTWRDDPQINPGGFLGDAGSHKLDALLFVTGLTPASVFARSDNCGSRVPIVTTASVMTHEGVPVALDFIGNAHHQAEDLQIHCQRADLMVRDWRVWIAEGNVVRPLEPLEPDSQPALTFLDVLDGTLENPAPAACALPVLLLTEAILESSRSGLPVPVEREAD